MATKNKITGNATTTTQDNVMETVPAIDNTAKPLMTAIEAAAQLKALQEQLAAAMGAVNVEVLKLTARNQEIDREIESLVGHLRAEKAENLKLLAQLGTKTEKPKGQRAPREECPECGFAKLAKENANCTIHNEWRAVCETNKTEKKPYLTFTQYLVQTNKIAPTAQ
jgi:DNA repair exonuclease SbcCD ATPase subunit